MTDFNDETITKQVYTEIPAFGRVQQLYNRQHMQTFKAVCQLNVRIGNVYSAKGFSVALWNLTTTTIPSQLL
jgi:hypothetical protein